MSNKLLDTALEYLEKYKFSIVPAYTTSDHTKKTYVKWKKYQEELPTREEVISWWEEWPNAMIACVTGKLSKLLSFDLDIYKLDGAKKQKVQELIPWTIQCPTSKTPRGGIHKHFLYPDDREVRGFVGKDTNGWEGFDIRGEGSLVILPPSSNGNKIGYSWVPGKSLLDLTLQDIDKVLLNNILTSINNKRESEGVVGVGNGNISKHFISFHEPGRNDSLFHVSYSLSKGGMDDENVLYTAKTIGYNCVPPLDDREIETIVKSAVDRAKKKSRSIPDEIREYISISTGSFSVSKVSESISFHDKGNIRTILHRLSKGENAIIEPDKRKGDGWYRKIEKIEEANWFDVEVNPLDIRYPFGIDRLVYTLPKSIVVVAGSGDAGKTAFLLNFIDINTTKMQYPPIHYFSSEMGTMEIKDRLSKFQYPGTYWKNRFHFYEYPGPFAQVIKPNDINIIDYLEIEDFTQVAVQIRDIFDKLEKGIAVIAIQKKFGADLARGGELSMEKARLYVNLDYEVIKIRKAKNWRTEVNPNGLTKNFKLLNGHKIIEDARGWYK